MLSHTQSYIARATLLLTLVLSVFVRLPASAVDCFTQVRWTVCRCINCTYVVVCGARLGLPPSIEISLCTATNPGFLVSGCTSAETGSFNCNCTTGYNCGTATVVGRCCGGARTTLSDIGLYLTCTPENAGCGAGGTGTR